MQIGVLLQSVHCYVSKRVFVVFFPSVSSVPRRITMHKRGACSFTVSSNDTPTALVCMMYDTRTNDSGQTVTHPLGSVLLSLDKARVAHATFKDYSAQPPLKNGNNDGRTRRGVARFAHREHAAFCATPTVQRKPTSRGLAASANMASHPSTKDYASYTRPTTLITSVCACHRAPFA